MSSTHSSNSASPEIIDVLGEDGVLSEHIDGFQSREGQLAMAGTIADVIEQKSVLIAEAGTGIGKTFAYLIPALMSGTKTLVSTGTRHLQDQLYKKDLPLIIDALDISVTTALLKGRSNYLCLHRMDNADTMEFMTRETRMALFQVKDWSKRTDSGDIAELDSLAEDDRVWSVVTSTNENCLGSECPEWDNCHVVKARRAAQSADIIVVNHHLLLADMALKDEGFGELLPEVETFIIDEAHQLPEIASSFFGQSVSSRQMVLLANDVIAEQLTDAPDMKDLREQAQALVDAARNLRLAFGVDVTRDAWSKIMYKPSIQSALDETLDILKLLQNQLEMASARGKGLENCYDRTLQIVLRLESFKEKSTNQIDWYETYSRSFVLHQTPLDLSERFRQQMEIYQAAWIFTSATLQVAGDFNHFASRLGVDKYQSGAWLSPFDYPQRSMMFLPANMPQPSDWSFTSSLIEQVLPIIEMSGGRTFLLFTSYRALNEAHALLKDKVDYPLFIQGEKPKHQLIQLFKEAGNALLLGTSSFWEGVDVRGDALTCVVIDKLPFASPGDPVLQARMDVIRNEGGNPFMDFQLPTAVINMKQGAGRLIRDVKDYGVLVIGDPRITQKHYGKVFLNSLPPMPVTQSVDDIDQFYKNMLRESGDEVIA